MRFVPAVVKPVAFIIVMRCTLIPFTDVLRVWGYIYDCAGQQLVEAINVVGQIHLDGASREEGQRYCVSLTGVDLRSLDMMKAGCCPPQLTTKMLWEGPG